MKAESLRAIHEMGITTRAKLSDEDVAAIRAELASGAPGKDVARARGVQPSTISRIKTGLAWRTAESKASCAAE